MEPKLPEANSATDNSWRVALKAVPGFIVGLIVTIAAVPGVQEAVVKYFTENLGQFALNTLLALGASGGVTGLINFFLDKQKKGMQTY